VGYGFWNQVHSIFSTVDLNSGGSGWLGRFSAGCDYQTTGSNFVIGAFGDYDLMDLEGSMSTQLVNAAFPGAPSQANEKATWAWSAGARIGYLIAPMVLTYVDGGFTRAHFDQMNVVTSVGVPVGNAFPAQTYNGWFLGGGIEYNVNWLPIQGLLLRTEYRYARYSSADLTEFSIPTGLPLAGVFILHSRPETQTITTSLIWRLWGAQP
jgi:outer membrane immunogenic protein